MNDITKMIRVYALYIEVCNYEDRDAMIRSFTLTALHNLWATMILTENTKPCEGYKLLLIKYGEESERESYTNEQARLLRDKGFFTWEPELEPYIKFI